MLEKYSADNPVNKVRMTWAFAFEKPSHIVASFFGSGVLRPGPGTWGTLAGWLVYVGLSAWVTPFAWLIIAAVTLIVGAWACGQTNHDLGVEDHGSIVIDEVFAIWLVLALIPQTLYWQIAGFVTFRFFDIVKLPPASYFDRNMKNGLGVMMDDAVAALYALAVLWVAQWAMGAF